jgi:Fe-S-cluster-containing hydrogenase component 2
VSAIDRKRCHHCVGPLSVVQLEEHDGFTARGVAVLCERCDGEPHGEPALVVPESWD